MWWKNQETDWSYIHPHTGSRENRKSVQESQSLSSKAPPRKGFITFPNSKTNWGPSIQIQESLGAISISHSNQDKPHPVFPIDQWSSHDTTFFQPQKFSVSVTVSILSKSSISSWTQGSLPTVLVYKINQFRNFQYTKAHS